MARRFWACFMNWVSVRSGSLYIRFSTWPAMNFITFLEMAGEYVTQYLGLDFQPASIKICKFF